MNAAARVTLKQLLQEGSIEAVPVDATVVGHLGTQASNHLRTAQAGADSGDNEGAFQLAYDACRKQCMALILAAGFRPRNEKGHHAVTFEAAAALATNFGKRKLVNEAGDLRYVRNNAEYRAEVVDRKDVDDAIAIGLDLVEAFTDPIEKLLSRAS